VWRRVAIAGVGVLDPRLVGPAHPMDRGVGRAWQAARVRAAGQDLGPRRQVGGHAVMALGAAGMDAEAGDDFVKYKESLMFRGQLAQRIEESAADGHRAEMAAGRL